MVKNILLVTNFSVEGGDGMYSYLFVHSGGKRNVGRVGMLDGKMEAGDEDHATAVHCRKVCELIGDPPYRVLGRTLASAVGQLRGLRLCHAGIESPPNRDMKSLIQLRTSGLRRQTTLMGLGRKDEV
jgi:hypothetical protein